MNSYAILLLSGLALTSCAGTDAMRPRSNGPDSLQPPVRIQAAGEYINLGSGIGHTGPHLLDLDEDGLQDLLVGNFSGNVHFYQNTGTHQAPVYAAGQRLEANGEVIKIPNW